MSNEVVRDTKACIDTMSPLKKNYIVMSVLNASDEPSGNPDYDKVIATNTELEKEFGRHYLDIRSVLATEPNDTIPASLRSDSIHLNDAGYQIVVDEVIKFINYNNL